MAIEDFTGYSEVDPDGVITVTANEISVVNASRNSGSHSYVADDKEVGHFSGDIEHLFDSELNTSANFGAGTVWSLTNDLNEIDDNTTDKLYFLAAWSNGALFILREVFSSTRYSDIFTGSADTRYYITLSRDEAIGSYGQLKALIYSDSIRTVLVDTLTVTLHSKNDLRYVGGAFLWKDATAGTITYDTRNLDLQEVAATGNPWYYYTQQ